MLPNPANTATMRGPKSRAGFQPAWVTGANKLISAATVQPTKNGTSVGSGAATLSGSDSAKITSTKIAVLSASTPRAPSGEIGAAVSGPVPKTAGFGKYSP